MANPRRLTRLVLSLGLAVAATSLGTAAGASSPAATAEKFRFATPCGFSHRAPDDPIVFPGRPGAAHSHDFFGNRSTRARSTHASLLRGATSCRRPDDTAAYWVPTLYRNGRAVTPLRAQIYYRGGRDPGSVRPHPAGLKMIAGSHKATTPQDPRIVSWGCGETSGVERRSDVPVCPRGHSLRLRIRFQDCWDGRRLDSPDHASHVAHSKRGRCSARHPVVLPAISFNVVYPISGGPGVTLASGSRHSAHADFFNAWKQSTLSALVRRCINQGPVADRERPCAAPRRR